jgi:hypothetical protein
MDRSCMWTKKYDDPVIVENDRLPAETQQNNRSFD